MPGTRLYACENTVGTKTTYRKGTAAVASSYEGICKGQAVAWCQNMLSGTPPQSTKPDYVKAGALQVLYERDSDGGSESLFNRANLRVSTNVTGNGHALVSYIARNPGVYQIHYDGHALGAANHGGRFYFFDSEQGLFELDTDSDLQLKFFDGYESGKYVQAWKLS